MCYSALVRSDYREFVRMFGARISIKEFVELYVERSTDNKVIIPKAMSHSFLESPSSPEDLQIVELIRSYDSLQRTAEVEEIMKQKTRLHEAERKLEVKVTKTASEDKRIATKLIKAAERRLDDLRRTVLEPRDSRIFPAWYAPVMIVENGQLCVKPMRYRCRPQGMPESIDVDYPGCYNARRNKLRSNFWKPLFGHKHGLVLIDVFYEKVLLHRLEGRDPRPGEKEQKVELVFSPRPRQLMLVPCIWDRWTAPGKKDLLSFAAITDEPPPEVQAAGHDRCLIPIKPENAEVWLEPSKLDLDALDEILEDKVHPYYEHKLAA
ncbi:SOS response-associated peptidase family protein [Ralstonia pseudosolanacearum]|uniref:SOS response-associated peptidase family protein n=1 Tax=Ralstonia pseudosolanacearum TaxID=1310165 RepID=UPI003CF963AB